jgi:hypothetical protein
MRYAQKIQAAENQQRGSGGNDRACQFAYGDDAVDAFMDEVFAEASRLTERREAHGEQTRTE